MWPTYRYPTTAGPYQVIRRGGGAAPWDPGDLSGLGITLLVALMRAMGLLWQDLAKTIPATADGDSVYVAVCPFTGLEWVAPSEDATPLLWDEGGGVWALVGDGVDDILKATVTVASPASIVAGWKSNVQLFARVWAGSTNPSQANSTALVLDPSGTTCYVLTDTGGDVTVPGDFGVYRTLTAEYGTAATTARVNGAAAGSPGAGSTDSSPEFSVFGVGTSFSPSRITGLIVAGPISASDRTQAEAYVTATY